MEQWEITNKAWFKSINDARDKWKAMEESERKAAFDKWRAKNPTDFRRDWDFKLISICKHAVKDILTES